MTVTVSMLAKLRVISRRQPLLKGMIAYGVLWPTASVIQQELEGRSLDNIDWMRCLRYSIYGGFYVAPTLYGWIKLTSIMWPKTNLKSGITKALVDQISYGPFAMSSFYIGMSLLEFKSLKEAIDELKVKFWSTYKVGICVWPFLQTFNFAVIPERNRVLFVSVCSVMWTTFLAYMKQLEKNQFKHSTEEILES